MDREFLATFERIYIAFDNDGPGKEAAKRVGQLFKPSTVYEVKFSKYKDASAYLEAGEENALRNLFWNAKKYLPETVVSSVKDFSKILSIPPERGISYPFPTLDKMLYGIRKGESVLFTALEGVGKTEIMHTIEHHLLKEMPDDCAMASIFLEEPESRHLQTLVSKTLQKPCHLPETGISEEEKIGAIESLVRNDDRLFIYTHFGSDNPDNLLSTIRFLVSGYNCLYIILDHVNMVCTGLGGEDERRALEYFCTNLGMMVKELNFALIMVSHVNDDGQTRSSRWTSKIAHIRVDLERDLRSDDPVIRNSVSFMVSKNRYSGLTGNAGKYLFDSYTRQYREIT